MDNNSTNQNLVIPADYVPTKAYEAIFERLATPNETFSKVALAKHVIREADLIDLHHRLIQISQQFKIKSCRSEFIFHMKEGGVYRFTSLEKFEASNLGVLTKRCIAVVLEFDLLIVGNANNDAERLLADRYKVSIRVQKEKPPFQFDAIGPMGVRLRLPEESTIETRVDFADFGVSRTLVSTVDEWIDGLKKDDHLTISSKARIRLRKVFEFSPGIIPLVAIIGGIIFEPVNFPNLFTPVRYILMVILIAILALVLAVWIDGKATQTIETLSPTVKFALTAGDLEENNEIDKSRRSARFWISLLLVGFGLAIIAGLCSNYLFLKLIS